MSYYKQEVLSGVLNSETPVKTFDLSLELNRKHGDDFDLESFQNACGVVAYYLGDNKGELICKGTGLPQM